MPQPFKPKSLGRFHVGPGVLNRFPEHAASIGRIAALEEQIQTYTALILASMLGESKSAGLIMYTSLTGSTQRRQVIDAVATETLEKDDIKAFQKLRKDQSTSRRLRNSAVHALWASTDEQPDVLLRIDPNDQIKHFATTGIHPMRDGDRSRLLIWKWDAKDFEAAESAASSISTKLVKFMTQIEHKYPMKADAKLAAAVSGLQKGQTR